MAEKRQKISLSEVFFNACQKVGKVIKAVLPFDKAPEAVQVLSGVLLFFGGTVSTMSGFFELANMDRIDTPFLVTGIMTGATIGTASLILNAGRAYKAGQRKAEERRMESRHRPPVPTMK